MKRIRMFFVAAALVLVTAGVFAGKSKFTTNYTLEAYESGTYYPISQTFTTFSGIDLTLSQANSQAELISSSGATTYLYAAYLSGTTQEYAPVYTSGF